MIIRSVCCLRFCFCHFSRICMIILSSFFGTLIVPNPSHAYNMAYTLLSSQLSFWLPVLPGGHGARANWRRLRTKVAMVAGWYSPGILPSTMVITYCDRHLRGDGKQKQGSHGYISNEIGSWWVVLLWLWMWSGHKASRIWPAGQVPGWSWLVSGNCHCHGTWKIHRY